MLPVGVGTKSNAMVQLAPGASSKAADELGVVCWQVEEASQSKLTGTLGLVPIAGNGNMRGALPSLLTSTVFGLSALVAPMAVAAKGTLGGWVKSSFNTRKLFLSPI